MPRRSSPSRWSTTHSIEDDAFEFRGRWYHITADITVSWCDDSDFDREYGYGESIEAEEVEVDTLSIVQIDPDSGDTLCENVTDAEVIKAAEEWADERGREQDYRE